MGTIYELATYAIIFLGVSTPEKKEIFHTIASQVSYRGITAFAETNRLAHAASGLGHLRGLAREHISQEKVVQEGMDFARADTLEGS